MKFKREILIVTTFKEFNESRDSKIQEFWLQNLNKQTYKNFKIIVTNFREKNVFNALRKSNINFKFFQSNIDCLYSITEMINNLITVIKKGKQIVLYPSPDHIFDDNFFEKIVDNFVEGSGGTSFPHYQYLSINDYNNKNYYDEYFDRYNTNVFDYDPNKHIPETLYFDADLLLDKNWQIKFNQFQIYGTFPGIGLHLLLLTRCKKLYNLLFITKIHKIISHVNPETNELDMINFLSESHKSKKDWNHNGELILNYSKSIGVKKIFIYGNAFITRKLAMFLRFKPIGNIFQKKSYYIFLLKYLFFPVGRFIFFSKFIKILKN